MEELINTLKFDASGLIPAVVQNIETNEVLMVAYMNADTLSKLLKQAEQLFGQEADRKLGKGRYFG